ncbi:MAG: antitoxin [Proteobacteria bacterium]|nr:antitoxin [Pseudomonadota bacterium]MBI3495719.1 antitoxin [Pseudomonadota bacterium]
MTVISAYDQAWQMEAIKLGIAAADRGELVEDDAVGEWIDSWGRPDEMPAPANRHRRP